MALPIALLFADGWLKAIGVIYLGAWILVFAPSTAIFLLMLVDSYLLFRRRKPILLPSIIEMRVGGVRIERPAVHAVLHRLAEVSVYANPIANLAGAMLSQACDWRSDMIDDLVADAKQRTQRVRRVPIEQPSMTPALELATPLFERFDSRLACV